MYRILFMPLLQIPSGHHHVADCIKEQLTQASEDYHCEKIEILSRCFGKAEAFVSTVYLQWIHRLPSLYSQIYKHAAVKGDNPNKRYYLYERLFLKKVQQFIKQKKPDVIICTHALPSYLLNRLKKKNAWSGVVINVYTDYFINELWGIDEIDYHFVPCLHIKHNLLNRGIKPEQIMLTGIPIHPIFKSMKEQPNKKDRRIVLISGGNLGAGSIQQLLHRLTPSGSVNYKVLCGKNEVLYKFVEYMNHPNIKPLPYLETKQEMNQLYDEADAIITKPGGVTITECLWKKLPILVYEALPGQEEFNLHYLKSQGLVFHLESWDSSKNVENSILDMLANDLSKVDAGLNAFFNDFEEHDAAKIIKEIVAY